MEKPAIHLSLDDAITTYVIALYWVKEIGENKFEHNSASGFLLELPDKVPSPLLMTAGHVAEAIDECQREGQLYSLYFIKYGKDTCTCILVEADDVITTYVRESQWSEPGSRTTGADLGFLLLKNKVLDQLYRSGVRGFGEPNLSDVSDLSLHSMCIAGFPESHREFASRPFDCFASDGVNAIVRSEELVSIRPRHVRMTNPSFSENGIVFECSPVERAIQSVKGMSGCPALALRSDNSLVVMGIQSSQVGSSSVKELRLYVSDSQSSLLSRNSKRYSLRSVIVGTASGSRLHQ